METYTTFIPDQILSPNALEYRRNPVDAESIEEEKWQDKVSTYKNAKQLDDFFRGNEDSRGFRREVFLYIQKFLGDSDDAQDVMQNLQLNLWRKRNSYTPTGKLRTWIFTLAKNQCIDYQRRNKRHRGLSLDQSNSTKCEDEDGNGECCYGDILEARSEKTVEYNESSEIVRRGLSMLPENSRKVIELIYFQGLKYREAADILQIPLGTVKSRMHTAIGILGESPLIRKLNEAA